MRCEFRVGSEPQAGWTKPEVELRICRRRRHYPKRFDAHGLERTLIACRLRDRTPAKRAPKPQEQGKEHGAPATIVCKRYRSAAVGSWKCEKGCFLSRLHGRERCI
jgi:hypothetical protein